MRKSVTYLLLTLLSCSLPMVAADGPAVEEGVSQALAEYRSLHVDDVIYNLSFTIPERREQKLQGTAEILFKYDGDADLQLDFSGYAFPAECYINDKLHSVKWEQGHIILPRRLLVQGGNVVRLEFLPADKALNRSDDYLYTLFVPALARSVFPCFDQPDIKATFKLHLTVPEGWQTMSSDLTRPLPTYLFSFVAGRFHEATATRGSRTLRALYRESDPQKVAQLDKIFDAAALSLDWMEHYTNIRYPFSSYGFVVLPGYQFGGMEHPGAIQFLDKTIFLGNNPTPDEELKRMELIAHETAHMWFGDLVTMKWFNDVWTKEVFANFMASKIVRLQFPSIDHDLNFLKAHYVPALSTDRTDGTHAIQQPLANLKDAGLLYGNIIYHKAPIMMRKLEQLMGEEALQKGLQRYLLKYAFKNATWDDLIRTLLEEAPQADVTGFSEAWVKQKGLPTITTEVENSQLVVRQQDPYKRGLLWQQRFKVGLFYGEAEPIEVVDVNMQQAEVRIPLARKPYAVIPNYDGSGYGRFVNGENSAAVEELSWQLMPAELNRYAAVMTYYENYQLRQIKAGEFLNKMNTYLMNESNPLMASTLCSYINAVSADLGKHDHEFFEYFLYNDAVQHPLSSVRQQMMRSLSQTATSPTVVADLYKLWQQQSDPLLNERDYTRMAWHLAIVLPEQWQQIVSTQRGRLHDADQLREFDFVARACNPDWAVQKQLFRSLLEPENRSVEPWATEMLALLSCREREPMNNDMLLYGLNELLEIQRTGDIFFPTNWLDALLSAHRSQDAKRRVQTFIDISKNYPPALMNKIKQAAHPLLTRAHD